MKKPIRHQLFTIPENFVRDPVLMQVARLVFDWANEMGLEGKAFSDLQFEFMEGDDPLNVITRVHCKIGRKDS